MLIWMAKRLIPIGPFPSPGEVQYFEAMTLQSLNAGISSKEFVMLQWPWGTCDTCGGDLDPSDTEPDSLVQSEDGFDLCPACGFTDAEGRRFGNKDLAIKYNS
jgi:hypothetical protein